MFIKDWVHNYILSKKVEWVTSPPQSFTTKPDFDLFINRFIVCDFAV